VTDCENPVPRASKPQGSRSIWNVVRPSRRLREGKSNVLRFASTIRKDRLYRTSVLLVADNVLLGALGGLFVLIATHVWEPRSIGIVSAFNGAAVLLVIAATLGLPSTIVAYLAGAPDQALMVRGALFATVPVGVALLATLWLIPGHAGVPLNELGVSIHWAVPLTMVFVAASLTGMLIDPAFLSRQEVSWTVSKDLTSMLVRFLALFFLAGTGTAGLFAVAVIYVAFAAIVDLALLRWRLRRAPRPRLSTGIGLVRSHASFAAGNQVAVLVAMLPTSLLPVIVLADLGAASAAYVAIPMAVLGVLTVVPSMTAQSLFAEMSAHPEEVVEPVRKALRGAYIVTLPLAVITIVVAPSLLNLFGHGYSIHGRDLVRWGAASSIFFCLNYVSDIVLLARKLVRAYVVANVVGTVFVLISLFVGVRHGLDALGLGWFVGQGCYCAVSCIVLTRYVGRRNLMSVVRYVLR
jgi:O-antigen/teichoic acid export membrane protein